MLKLFSAFRKEKIWDFDGGIHPPEMKSQSNGTPLRQIPLATRYVMPLKQHIGAEGELCVKEGDSVLRGQPLTFGRGRMCRYMPRLPVRWWLLPPYRCPSVGVV